MRSGRQVSANLSSSWRQGWLLSWRWGAVPEEILSQDTFTVQSSFPAGASTKFAPWETEPKSTDASLRKASRSSSGRSRMGSGSGRLFSCRFARELSADPFKVPRLQGGVRSGDQGNSRGFFQFKLICWSRVEVLL